MSARERPVFLYDFNSPDAYLAAARVDEVLPIKPRWQPIAFAFMLRAHNRSPWSFDERQRPIGIAECERRAQA
jgi:2-hydroxychromene-2-carboxylate isomerase